MEGNGAVIYAVPEKPVLLTENTNERSGSTLGLTWQDGADSGGHPVIDYKVTVTSSDGLYSTVTEQLTSQAFTALTLTKGVTYYFTVQSRNAHGYSLESEQMDLLCAIKPDIPTNILTFNNNADIDIQWTVPYDNGSPITAYTIFIQTSTFTYEEETNQCDGTDAAIVSSATC